MTHETRNFFTQCQKKSYSDASLAHVCGTQKLFSRATSAQHAQRASCTMLGHARHSALGAPQQFLPKVGVSTLLILHMLCGPFDNTKLRLLRRCGINGLERTSFAGPSTKAPRGASAPHASTILSVGSLSGCRAPGREEPSPALRLRANT